MSRFADPTKTETVPLGACQCPGAPHEGDEATVRYQLGASALARVGAAGLVAARSRDPYAAYRQLVLECVVSWNLVDTDEDGDAVPVPITPAIVAEMDEDTLVPLAEAIDALVQSKGQLPNAPGAPSPASPRGSASHTRKPTPKPGT